MDARNWSRHLVEKEVRCVLADAPGAGFLYDLSGGGCMVELAEMREALGRPLTVELYEQETVRGTVVWQAGACVGVSFDAPIHDAVVRHVGFVPPEIPFAEQHPRDRFGRALPPLDAGEKRWPLD